MNETGALQLLQVSKCTTTSSLNKNLRMRYEKEGTTFFVTKENGEYLFSKTYNPDAEKVVVRKNRYPLFLYIPVKKVISEEGYLSIYKKDEISYIVKPSTEDEINTKSIKRYAKGGSGHLVNRASANGINIVKEDASKLFRTEYLKMHVIAGEGKLYMEVSACSEQEELPSLTEAASPYGGWEFLGKAEEFTYKRKIPKASGVLPLPISFIKKTGMNPGEQFHTYFRQDGTFIIEPKPLNCDICGRPINRYEDVAHEICVCRACKHEIPLIQKKKLSGYDYTKIREELNLVREAITSLM